MNNLLFFTESWIPYSLSEIMIYHKNMFRIAYNGFTLGVLGIWVPIRIHKKYRSSKRNVNQFPILFKPFMKSDN